jgi:hypothetical protein
MSRGGHNWKGGGTVDACRRLDVMRLSRAGYLCGSQRRSWGWSSSNGSKPWIQIHGGRDAIILEYRVKSGSEDWQSVNQQVPIQWTPCRFGGERPWFICAVHANGVYCGRRVAKLYDVGKLFACRHCYRLGYQSQRGDRMDQAHHRLKRLHEKLGADYDDPEMPPPPKPKWMRWKTYSGIADQIEVGQDRLDHVFTIGAQRFIARIDKLDQRGRRRR